jgi:hypothetical protein
MPLMNPSLKFVLLKSRRWKNATLRNKEVEARDFEEEES